MAIQSLSYLDIPNAKRRDTTAKALNRLRERMGDPSMSPEQRESLRQQIAELEAWAQAQAS